jgi:hypothetical protein
VSKYTRRGAARHAGRPVLYVGIGGVDTRVARAVERASRGRELDPDGRYHVLVAHDDWCPRVDDSGLCTCSPTAEIHAVGEPS